MDGKTMETVKNFIVSGGGKITADDDCSHGIKRRLLLGRKALAKVDGILKSRHITNKGTPSQNAFPSSHVWV